MNLEESINSIKAFGFNIFLTVKDTAKWIIISYIIPIINIGLIWGMRRSFELDLSVLIIVLVTNACFITSVVFLIEKKRDVIQVLNIAVLLCISAIFTVAVVQMEIRKELFPLEVYVGAAFLTFMVSVIFGLISKYDEVGARTRKIAEDGKKTKETQMDGKVVKL